MIITSAFFLNMVEPAHAIQIGTKRLSSSQGSGKSAHMRRFARVFAAGIHNE